MGGDQQECARGWAVRSLPLPPTCLRQAQLLLISRSDRGGEIQPSPGHGHSPEQPALAKPERGGRLGPRETHSCRPVLGSPGRPCQHLQWAVKKGKDLNGWRNRKGGKLCQHPSGWLACFFPPHSFISIIAKSSPTSLLLRKWQWLSKA